MTRNQWLYWGNWLTGKYWVIFRTEGSHEEFSVSMQGASNCTSLLLLLLMMVLVHTGPSHNTSSQRDRFVWKRRRVPNISVRACKMSGQLSQCSRVGSGVSLHFGRSKLTQVHVRCFNAPRWTLTHLSCAGSRPMASLLETIPCRFLVRCINTDCSRCVVDLFVGQDRSALCMRWHWTGWSIDVAFDFWSPSPFSGTLSTFTVDLPVTARIGCSDPNPGRCSKLHFN